MCKNKIGLNNNILSLVKKNILEKRKKIKKEKKTIFDKLKSRQILKKEKNFLDLKKFFLNSKKKEKEICCKEEKKFDIKNNADFFFGNDLIEKNSKKKKEVILENGLYKKKNEDLKKNLNKNIFIYSENTKTTLNSENEILTKRSIFKNSKKKIIKKKINSIQNLFSTKKRVKENLKKKNTYKNKFYQLLIKNRKSQNQTKLNFQNIKENNNYLKNQKNFFFLKDEKLKIFYNIEKKIGEGAFATVYKGISKYDKKEVAIKTIDNEKLKKKNIYHIIKNEIKILKKLENENIIKLLDIVENKEYTHLIFNLSKGKTLTKFLNDLKKNKLSEKKIKKIFLKILKAVKYLHSKKIYHRDLKLDNIMINYNFEKNIIQELFIIDFGFAIYNKNQNNIENQIESICGTPRYMAPEIYNKKYFGSKVDIWALGVIFYRLLTGFFPFKAKGGYEIYDVKDFGGGVSRVFKNVFCVPEERVDLDGLIKLVMS